jgi:UDP-N-acetylmuramate dehydrogenase
MPKIIQQQIPLAPLTTLGVGGNAEYYADVTSLGELSEVTSWAQTHKIPLTVLGGGSNILVSDGGIRGLVIRLLLTRVEFSESGEEVLVHADAGVLLDDLVGELVEKNLWGLENLSMIPGTVGAVPIQNVGAYGVEAKDVITAVFAYDTEMHAIQEFSNEACAFGYRDSIFKHSEGKRCIITSVIFRVSKKANPQITYKDLKNYFGIKSSPELLEIRNAVKDIRRRKFPNWKVIGTAGSFFKNPVISRTHYEELRNTYPELPGYATDKEHIKVSLGWILDHVCGVRGYAEGKVGLFREQALVLVCEKGAHAEDVKKFSDKIIEHVYDKTKITIEREVTVLG